MFIKWLGLKLYSVGDIRLAIRILHRKGGDWKGRNMFLLIRLLCLCPPLLLKRRQSSHVGICEVAISIDSVREGLSPYYIIAVNRLLVESFCFSQHKGNPFLLNSIENS